MTRRTIAFLVAALALGTPLVGQETKLTPGRTLSGTLSEGDTVRYTVTVADSSYVLGEVNQISVDVLVRALRPDGEQLARFDGLGRGDERFAGRIIKGGIYTLEVIAVGEEAGAFEMTLLRAEPLESDPIKFTDQIMAQYDFEDSPGAAVHVWRDGKVLYSNAYGMANLAYGIPFRTDTRTNIGSTTKQFTAFAVMLQADRGVLSLDDDIRKHIPELPEFDETITVRHIITHTSGLREFLNLLVMSGRRLDHGDWIDRGELIDIVQHQTALQNSPGAEWNYNNTAFGLAALIVERTSGQDFHVFMRENVFEPLGMTRSMVRPSPEHIVPDRSEGYTPGPDGFREIGDLGGAVGAGGIYTTLADLQTWVQNYANPRVGSPEIFAEMMTSYILNDGEETGYGYGLSIDEHNGLRRVHHGGADVAHRSMLIYYPEINAGITTQSNHAQFNSTWAAELAEMFFADAMEGDQGDHAQMADEESFDPDAYDPKDFDEFAGRYSLDVAPDFILTFMREGDTLYTQATGQQRLRINPTSDSTFALTVVEASVIFHHNEQGEVDGLTLLQNGENHATRLKGDEALGWTPTPEELAAFEGRYFSEELETFYTLTVKDGALVMSQKRLDDAHLTPSKEDTFTGSSFTFSFERAASGEVSGFRLSNVRTRDVLFARTP